MAVIRLHQQGICVFITLGQTTSGFYPPYLESKSGSFPLPEASSPPLPPAAIKNIFRQNADIKMHYENWCYHHQNS